VVAATALRLRRSQFMSEYFVGQLGEEKELTALLNGIGKTQNNKKAVTRKKTPKKK